MPHVIVIGSRPLTRSWWVRTAEALAARVGWLTGRVPHGVTPTLATSRWWH